MTNKYQRTDTEEKELNRLLRNQMQPQHITGIDNTEDVEKSYMRIIKIDYEQGFNDKEMIFEININ